MTLLEATSHLIDCAKTNAHESDRVMARAIKRMEQRLRVLQLRTAKARRKARDNAWIILCIMTLKQEEGGDPTCRHCGHVFSFGQFVKTGFITHRGQIRAFHCPACDVHLIGYQHQCPTCKERSLE